ncbi:DNA-directed RNA polymerase subunit beta' [Bienertia sinuspersici]
MLGAGLQFNRNRSDDRFYIPAKARRNYNQNQKNPQIQRTQGDDVSGGLGGNKCRDKPVVSGSGEPENQTEETPKPASPPIEQVQLPLSNVERFLESITPSVHAQYLSKTTMRGLRTCDVEFQPYFMLSDLWESFKEWSAYGAGVPLVLNGSDSVVQYYVPYLSGIQLYVDQSKSPVKSRRTSEDSDADFYSRDSSSDGSSDSERDRGLACSRGQRNHYSHPSDISLKMDRLLLRDQHGTVSQEGFSSDEGDSGTPQGCLLFEYLEHDAPYGREPLADKASSIADLALRFPALKSLRSCDLLASSWFSVAWYPIYRIPMGPTLKDLDACFLTYHSLYTPVGDAPPSQAPVVIYPSEIDGIPRISLTVFGLASYKFRGSLWTSSSGSDRQLVTLLSQATDSWLRLLQVNHPDYLFFCRNR